VIKRYSGHLSTFIELMEATAPAFRRACPEQPEQPVSLTRILLSTEIHLRLYAVLDVITAFTLARPLIFKYDVSYTPEMCSQLMEGAHGLQWLGGLPDLFIVLLAWITILYQEFGSSVDSEYVTYIEREVGNVKIMPKASIDPIFTIWRFVLQECWRQTVYVYLYMVSVIASGVQFRG
jgi:hypothetical protein